MDELKYTSCLDSMITPTQMLWMLPTIIQVLQKDFRGLTSDDGGLFLFLIMTDQEASVSDIKMKPKSFISWNIGKIDMRDGKFFIKKEIMSALKAKVIACIKEYIK